MQAFPSKPLRDTSELAVMIGMAMIKEYYYYHKQYYYELLVDL